MVNLCPTCGIRLTEELCQCPEVLIAEVCRLRRDLASERSDLGTYQEIIDEQRDTLRAQRKQVRSLRAKLMLERANTHEWVASMVDDGCIEATERTLAKSKSYHARARRLRAKADRILNTSPTGTPE